MKEIAVLGSTGSIGTQTMDVIRLHSDLFHASVIAAHKSIDNLREQAAEFHPHAIVITDEDAGKKFLETYDGDADVLIGETALSEVVKRDDVDLVLVAVVGITGLLPTLEAIRAGKELALANKESLVVGGDLLMPMARPGMLLPVDSEHAAIFQCYQGENPKEAHCIWLTCSGGPFFGKSRSELSHVTVKQALAHPAWNMGAKISIDSATLMNKGLERIEALHLFHVDMDFVNVVIHREAKIHSMVEYVDGSVIAHLGASDMRIPIQYALSYPARWESPSPRLDFRQLASLSFGEPDTDTFRCLKLADIAGREGGTLPCVLNAANEVAVDAFLHDRCSFTDIDAIVEYAMDQHDNSPVYSLDQLSDTDAWARIQARCALDRISR